MMDRSPVWIGLCDMALAVLAVVVVAVNPPKPARGVEMKAEMLASIEWDANVDADADIHMMAPSHKPTFYGSRDVGCATLDRDSRGFLNNVIALADGSQTKVESDKETIAIRCVEPGHYDLAANLYAYRVNSVNQVNRKGLGLKVHVEILGLNPTVRVLSAKDVVLDRVGETLVDPPLTPITASYQRLDQS